MNLTEDEEKDAKRRLNEEIKKLDASFELENEKLEEDLNIERENALTSKKSALFR